MTSSTRQMDATVRDRTTSSCIHYQLFGRLQKLVIHTKIISASDLKLFRKLTQGNQPDKNNELNNRHSELHPTRVTYEYKYGLQMSVKHLSTFGVHCAVIDV